MIESRISELLALAERSQQEAAQTQVATAKALQASEAKAAQAAAAKEPTAENLARQAEASSAAIVDYLQKQGLYNGSMQVSFDVASAAVTVRGQVGSQETREKVLLCCGNVAGVASVNDELEVPVPAPSAQFHTVVSGDNLSKIAKKQGTTAKAIRAANGLTGDKINVGQKLKIPGKGAAAEPDEPAAKALTVPEPVAPFPATSPTPGTGR
jgi:LysM repeat protein